MRLGSMMEGKRISHMPCSHGERRQSLIWQTHSVKLGNSDPEKMDLRRMSKLHAIQAALMLGRDSQQEHFMICMSMQAAWLPADEPHAQIIQQMCGLFTLRACLRDLGL